MSTGLLFCVGPFSKSPPCKFPPRKFTFCALQETVFLSTLIASYHPLFIHSQKKRHPCHLHPIPLAFWHRLRTIYVKLKAEITQISFYRFPNTKIRERTYILLMILLEKLMRINILNIHMLSPCNLHQITTYFDSNQGVSWVRLPDDMTWVTCKGHTCSYLIMKNMKQNQK